MQYQELTDDFVGVCQTILGNQLTGIYLHGSLAMGCFHAGKSDIDMIVIMEDHLSEKQKLSLMEQIIRLNRNAPAKGLELSFVKKEYCKPFVYPTPFELHFSPMHLQWFYDNPKDYVDKMKGKDKDLAAHFTMIHRYGVKLCGKEIADVFGAVPQKDYIDSIWHDIKNAPDDILNTPTDTILNLCRSLAYFRNHFILSKEAGGEWGLTHLDEKYRPLILQAKYNYQSNQGIQIDESLAQQFANVMLKEMKREIEKQ